MNETHGYNDRLNVLKECIRDETPVETFERLFDKRILEHIVKQSMLYAAQKNDHSFCVTEDEIKVFLGILMFSGYHKLPRERLFWCLDEDVSVPCISQAMSRNRYYQIKKYLHFADNSNLENQKKSTLPLGSKVVLELLECVAQPSDHSVFFDNYFTSHSLLKMLRDKGFRATGTIRENRTNKCPLPPKESMNKEERGHFRYMFDKTNSLLFVKWKDSNVVTMGTNYDTIEPQSKVKRWSSVKKEKVDVPQPQLFRKYNSSMGGVDLLDQGVNNYRISIQGKKWYWVIFTHMVNTALVNAWRIHMLNSGKQKVDLLSFIRSVTRHYLRCFSKASYSKTRPSPPVPTSIVQDEGGHFPGKNEKQLRCRQCHLRARWKCIKCNVTLCIERECFIQFHSIG
nr:unnamed protein product [Callosobruchus chinensis]CAH7763309.1 unnamed protein product [Callosobruchus chinensis]CAH7769864.1 unnamed protein product [Callosobruchus chinensis]